jgi:hypothetical protein
MAKSNRHQGRSADGEEGTHQVLKADHIQFLMERLDLLLDKYASIGMDVARPSVEMSGLELASVQFHNLTAPNSLQLSLHMWLKEFAPVAKKIVEAFGLSRFPTYIAQPERIPKRHAGTPNDHLKPRSETATSESAWLDITSTSDPTQAGLRVIMWAAAFEDPSLVDVEDQWQRSIYQEGIYRWLALLIVESEQKFYAWRGIADCVRTAFSYLTAKPAAVTVVKRRDTAALILAALCNHHGYDGTSVTKWDPIGVRQLSPLTEGKGEKPVSPSTVSRWFDEHFKGGHSTYQRECANKMLLISLKQLSGDYTPRQRDIDAAQSHVQRADQGRDNAFINDNK